MPEALPTPYVLPLDADATTLALVGGKAESLARTWPPRQIDDGIVDLTHPARALG